MRWGHGTITAVVGLHGLANLEAAKGVNRDGLAVVFSDILRVNTSNT
jgi:hypothetical protein